MSLLDDCCRFGIEALGIVAFWILLFCVVGAWGFVPVGSIAIALFVLFRVVKAALRRREYNPDED